jgi:hypothetical protein
MADATVEKSNQNGRYGGKYPDNRLIILRSSRRSTGNHTLHQLGDGTATFTVRAIGLDSGACASGKAKLWVSDVLSLIDRRKHAQGLDATNVSNDGNVELPIGRVRRRSDLQTAPVG